MVISERSLFGRSREQAGCYAAVDATCAGRRSIVLIEGEAGIGKTALAGDLASRAISTGFRVFTVTAHPNIEAALLPIAQALGGMLSAERETDPDAARALAFLEGDGRDAGARPDARSPTVAVTLALSRLLARWQSESPLLLWFDDAHWLADSAVSLLTSLTLANDVEQSQRILIVIAYRAADAGSALRRLVRQVRRDARSTMLTLDSLDELALFELARARMNAPPAASLVADLREYSRGNPLLAEELLRRHVADGRGPTDRLAAGVSGWADAADLVGERAAELPRDVQRVVSAAAFADEVDLALLAHVLDTTIEQVTPPLLAAVESGVLEARGDGYGFAHPVLWQAAYLRPGETERAALHAAVATALLKSATPRTPTVELAIARHVVRAGDLGAIVPLSPTFLRVAGEHALHLNDWGEAARYLAAYLAHGDDSDLEAAYLLAQAWYRAHDVARAIAQYERLATLAEERDDWHCAALALIGGLRAGLAHRSTSRGSPLQPDRLERALARLGPDGGEIRARAAQVISEVAFANRSYDIAISHAEVAYGAAKASPDTGLRVQTALALGLAHWGRLDLTDAARWFDDARQVAQTSDDLWVRGWAPVRAALVANMAGRLADARAAVSGSVELYERSRDWSEYSLAHAGLAAIALSEGNLATSERHALVALSMVERSEYGWTADIAYPAIACARALRGDWDEARDALAAWTGRVDRPWAYWAMIKTWQGGPPHATQALATFAARARHLGPVDLFSLGTVCAAIEVALVAGDRRRIATWLPILQTALDQGVVQVNGWSAFLPALLASCLAALGRADEAAAAYEAAIDLADRAGLRLAAARARLAWARDRAEAGDARGAADLATAAADAFAAMNIPALEASTRRLLRDADPTPPARVDHPTLTPREIEVLRAITRGLTNDQIADELVISPATARRHVANIYLKIDVPNRAAAALYAAEHGLIDSTN